MDNSADRAIFAQQVPVIFHQFCTSDEDISYLLADPVTRLAVVVDPNTLAERDYREVLRRLDLRLHFVLETHACDTHASAAPLLQAETGATVIAQATAVLAGVDRRVVGGEQLYLGEEVMRVMATPGHSRCSLSFLWRDRVFTGHTLLAGATGPCRRADSDAGRLYDSIRDRLYALPRDTLVCPGRTTAAGCLSDIGTEHHGNRELSAATTRVQFILRKQAGAPRNQA